MLDTSSPGKANRTPLLRAASALVVVLSMACVPAWVTQAPVDSPSPMPLPDTNAQQAVVRQYLDLVAAERYAAAWQLLTPERQRRETPEAFASDWQAWGRVELAGHQPPFVWPAAENEVRADIWIQHAATGGGQDRVRFDLERVGTAWRIADEHGRGHHDLAAPMSASTPTDLARSYVADNYGALWLATFEVLDEEPVEDGQAVIFRVLDPLLEPRTAGPRPTAILLFAQPLDGGWRRAGGGSIGTIAEMDRFAVSCAWTWLRFIAGEPTVAAFYCTVEDPRVGGHRAGAGGWTRPARRRWR